MSARVDLHLAGADDGVGERGAAPHQRAQARQQLGEGERLGQIVVRPDVEPVHAVVETVARREHEHRHGGALGAKAAANLHAVDAGNHQVEDHTVVLVVVKVLERGVAVAGAIDGVAVLPQPARQHGGEAGVVFDY